PETHGWHLYTNAAVGVWFGQFVLPDWDMFWSHHECGEYHAAARAISGGPVYVSDKPGQHDVGVLRKLVLHDGTVPRCQDVGRLTPDCLFANPTRDPVALKIFNFNRGSAVVGVFNAQYHAEEKQRVTVRAAVSPADVPGFEGQSFVVYAHRSRQLRRMRKEDRWFVRLPERGWELFTMAPIEKGVAVIGLAEKYNSGGTIAGNRWADGRRLEVDVRDGGELLIWAEQPPTSVHVEGNPCRCRYDKRSRALRVNLTKPGAQTVVVEFASSD
ncbi:MAG: Sip1-related alpha-galactosidase, partial [Verrucomicrobiae bacterium]|nr:Sip1-related alpha-galactosidase [Verrucomicrobiae bacterium]